MRGVNGETNRALRAWVRERFSGRCAYCDRHIGRRGTIDHYVPRSHGGGNSRRNLRWACLGCNQLKADMAPAAWEALRPRARTQDRPESRADLRVRLIQQAIARGRQLGVIA